MSYIVVIGDSFGVMKGGISQGISDGINQYNIKNNTNYTYVNLSCGTTTSLYGIYRLIKNSEIINKASFIITFLNVNEVHFNYGYGGLKLNIIERNIKYYYHRLSLLNSKIIVVLHPIVNVPNTSNKELILNIHRFYINKYGFNLVDLNQYYVEKNIYDLPTMDGIHQFNMLEYSIGKKIIEHLDKYLLGNCTDYENDLMFKIVKLSELENILNLPLENINHKNSLFNENVERLKDGIKLKFNDTGWYIIGCHSWTSDNKLTINGTIYSSIILRSKSNKIVKNIGMQMLMSYFNETLLIDTETFLEFNKDQEEKTEPNGGTHCHHSLNKRIDYCDIIGFLLTNKNELISEKEIVEKYNKCVQINNNFNWIFGDLPFDYSNACKEYEVHIANKNYIVKDKKISELVSQFNILEILDSLKHRLNNIAVGKKANISSFHPLATNKDPSIVTRLSNENIFHTNLEGNPWFEIDLEKEYNVFLIRIKNRQDCQDRLRSVTIELSLDKINYTELPSSCLEWFCKHGDKLVSSQMGGGKLEYLYVWTLNLYSARYVKISLKEKNYLHFRNIEIYSFE